MNIARKLALNLGWRAVSVLGPYVYLRCFFLFLLNFRAILRARNFSPLDRAMSTRPLKMHMNGSEFVIDCPYADQHVQDGTFTFGIVREIYIRNCYLRYGVSQAASNARTVLDLGANRGAFSLMMARQARLVIAVEVNSLFREAIFHNMAVNGFTNCKIETTFVGEGGACEDGKSSGVTISDLLNKHSLETVDLVKMDIEGSEFALFRFPEWLTRISALCMEVHPKYGDPQDIVTALRSHDFEAVVADGEFRPIDDLKQAVFIYAWNSRQPQTVCYVTKDSSVGRS